jgi:hypothetical protein
VTVARLTQDDVRGNSDVDKTLLSKVNEIAGAVNTLEEAEGGAGASNAWDSTSLAWVDDFLWQGTLTIASGWDQLPFGSIYGLKGSGTGARIDCNNGGTGRIGVVEMETGTDVNGHCTLRTEITSCDFGVGTWTYEAVVAFTTASDAANEYVAVIGFADTHYQTEQTRGAYFLYDRANEAVGGANAANAQKWQCVTAYGGGAGDRTLTLVDSPLIESVSWPNTGVYRLKIVANTTSVLFYINDTLVATHTTDVPATGPGACGAGLSIHKTAGAAASIMNVDYTRLAVTLNEARVP